MQLRSCGILSLAATVTLLLPTYAAAQDGLATISPGPQRVDIAGFGGFRLSNNWSDLVLLRTSSVAGGTTEQVLTRALTVEPGPVFNAAATYWEGRYGFRVHAGFSQSCLAIGRTCGPFSPLDDPADTLRVDAWLYDIGGAIGLKDYRPGTRIWPYVFLGVGGVTYDLERTVSPPLTVIDRRQPAEGRLIARDDDLHELLVVLKEIGLETRLAFNAGIGTDFRIPVGPGSLGLRLELSDHIHPSPLSVRTLELFGAERELRLHFGAVHNLRVSAGVVVQFGR
jgi:hypothetical protein